MGRPKDNWNIGSSFITYVNKIIQLKIFFCTTQKTENKVETLLTKYGNKFFERLCKGEQLKISRFTFFLSFETITGKLTPFEIETSVMPGKKFFLKCTCNISRNRKIILELDKSRIRQIKEALDTTDLAYKLVNYGRVC